MTISPSRWISRTCLLRFEPIWRVSEAAGRYLEGTESMANAQILVVADTPEFSSALIDHLLPAAGYKAVKADDFTPPPAADAILVDVSQLRSASPFGGLKAQRRMGCEAPAIL